MSKKIRMVLLALVLLIVIIGSGLYFPAYLTVYNVRKALENNDIDSLSNYVDYPSLRESLKASISAQMADRMKDERDNPFTVELGASFASALMNPIIDSLVSPQRLAMWMQREKPELSKFQSKSIKESETKKSTMDISMSYKDVNHFAIKPKEKEGADYPVEFIFKRNGLFTWKLTAMNIPYLTIPPEMESRQAYGNRESRMVPKGDTSVQPEVLTTTPNDNVDLWSLKKNQPIFLYRGDLMSIINSSILGTPDEAERFFSQAAQDGRIIAYPQDMVVSIKRSISIASWDIIEIELLDDKGFTGWVTQHALKQAK